MRRSRNIAAMDLKYINTEDRESLSKRTWSLMAMYKDGSGSGVDYVRTVETEEALTLIDAARTIDYYCNTINWDQLADVSQRLLMIVGDILAQDSPGPAKPEPRRALESSAKEFLRHLRRLWTSILNARMYVDSTTTDGQTYLHVLDSLTWTDRISKLDQLFSTAPDAWTRLLEQNGIRTTQVPMFAPDLTESLGASPDSGPGIPIQQYVVNAINEAQTVLSQFLCASEKAITNASHALTRIEAEVLFGTPVLADSNGLKERPVQLMAFELHIGQVRHVNSALHAARRVVIRGDPSVSTATDERRPETDVPHVIPEPSSNLNVKPLDMPASADDSLQTDTADNNHPAAFPPADIVAMAESFRKLAPQLERKWSQALSYAIQQDDITSEVRHWTTVLQAAQEKLHVRNANFNIAKFPLDHSDLQSLNSDARGSDRIWQDEVANIYTLASLAKAISYIAEPPQGELKFTEGRTTISRWWSTGAFSVVRSAADLVLRHLESIGAADADDRGATDRDASETAISPPLAAPSVDRYLRLGLKCLEDGLPEGALLYFQLACREAGVSTSPAPEVASALDRYIHGPTPQLGYSICLANIAYQTHPTSMPTGPQQSDAEV